MSKCLNAQILIAVPIREAIPVADLVQAPQDQGVLALGDHLAPVRVDQVVLVMMIGLLVVMIEVVLVIGLLVEILVIVRRVVMIGVQMIVRHVVTEQIPAQAVLVLGDHLALVQVDLVVLVMIVRLVVILGIVLLVGMIGVLMIVRLAVTSVIVPRVVMIGAQMIVRLAGTVLALVGRLVRAVMTAVMVGDEAVPVKKILLPASRVMRPSADV